MGSVISTTQTGYNEKTAVDNWAGEYVKRSVLQHKEKEVLDHPDGSVTFEKLDGAMQSRIVNMEQEVEAAKTSVINSDAKAVAAQNAVVVATAKAESAQVAADVADKKADLAQVTADGAELKATLAQTLIDEITQKVETNHEHCVANNEEIRNELQALAIKVDGIELRVGDIDTALDSIIAIQNELMGVSE